MTEDCPAAGGPECEDPSQELLDFYVNGSLEPSDSVMVRVHLATCRRCAAEVAELSQLAAALERHAIDPASFSRRRWMAPRFLWVAASIVAVSVALYLTWSRGTGVSHPGLDTGREAFLDLGAGMPRSDQALPHVEISPASRTLRIRLSPPIFPGARYFASIISAGTPVCPESLLGPLDAMGRGVITFPAPALEHAGPYELVLRIETRDADVRTYRYPFIVAPKVWSTGSSTGRIRPG